MDTRLHKTNSIIVAIFRQKKLKSSDAVSKMSNVGLGRSKSLGADIVSSEQRSKIMSTIKSKNTQPEMVVRSLCHEMGLRYRLHRKDLPGRPDLVFPRYRLCIFVHGCFWHRHPGCKYTYTPKSRLDFWLPKLARNVERDINAQQTLLSLGWRVLIVWECDTKNKEVLRTEIQKAFGLED